MKKEFLTVTLIMLTLTLTAFFSVFEVNAAGTSEYIKVGLKYSSTAVTSATLQSEEGFQLIMVDSSGFSEGMPLPAYTTIQVASENGAVVLRDESGTLLSSDLGSAGCIMPLDYQDDGVIRLDNVPYRGGIMFRVNSNGTMNVINYLSMENYIYGVLNSELHYSNPKEALKAQAVAARSFGSLSIGKHSSDGFDVCATTHCQVYKGYSGEYPATNQAVDETSGEVIYSQGNPVNAFYFKNSGGYTQNAEDVWSSAQSYLKSVKDPYCPSYPWSISLTFDNIKQKLEAAGYSPGTIESVAISGKNSVGYVCDLQIKGSSNTITLKKEQIRNVIGATVVKSLLFDLGEGTSGSGGVFISNGKSTAALNTDFYVISGDNKITKQKTDSRYCSNGTKLTSLTGATMTQIVTGGTVTFIGYGYGHGVGMPQDSAVEMAKQGFAYDEILKYYYTGIEIK